MEIVSDASLAERFWRKVDKTGQCWIWTAQLNKPGGYGHFSILGKKKLAHRVAWELMVSPIPDGFMLDHRCFNRKCVRPDHLRLATAKQNGEHRAQPSAHNASGIRGVRHNPANPANPWRGRVVHHGKCYDAGSHRTAAEATFAVAALRDRLFTHHEDWSGNEHGAPAA